MNDVRVHLRLPPRPETVSEARRVVRSAAARVQCGAELTETAELLVSEVVTNAVLHAATTVEVAVFAETGALRVEVGDASPYLPQSRQYDRLVSTGRGVHIIEALSDAWGVEVYPPGKMVWFELGRPRSPSAGTTAQGDHRQEESPRRSATMVEEPPAEVVLLNVPLLLHGAWQIHAESLLREYVLTRLDGAGSAGALQEHAALHDALALLTQHVVAPDLGADPDVVMAEATEPLVSAPRVVVPVPTASVAHFDLLERTLDAAAVRADRGELLTVPIQPELRDLRRWLCGQVRIQAGGGSAQPWVPESELRAPPHPARPAPAWEDEARALVAEIEQSDVPLLVADDTNRILAVSPSAAVLLGYDGPDALAGDRLIRVIPDRYRQAHVAGFTLHLLTGRAPLLQAPVTLPVLRADGTEAAIVLTVSARQSGSRSLFIAELEPAG